VAAEDSFPRGANVPREGTAKPKRDRPRLSLEQAVQTTLRRNPRVGEALSRIRQRVWEEQAVYSDFFPSATVDYAGTWNRYTTYSDQGLGPPDHMSRGFNRTTRPNIKYPYRVDPWKSFSGAVTVTQPIYKGGKTVSDYNIAKLQVTNSELQLQVDRQDLILEAYQAYYSMMLAELVLEVVRESISNLEKLKNLNEKFLRAGTVTRTDVLSTEGQLYAAYVEQRGFIKDIEAARARLNNLLSNPPETPIEIEQDYKKRSNSYNVPQIYNIALSNRDEIVQATNLIRQGIDATKSASASLLPRVDLTAVGNRSNDDWNVLDPEGNNDWTLTGVLTWTFNMFRSNSTVKQKREVVNELVLARQRLVQNISQNVKIAYLDMKNSEGNINDYRRMVATRSENFRLFQMRYQQGDVSFTEVLIAENDYVRSKANYYGALVYYRINEAILERQMGILRR
jgi:outer membrane protein TolC